GGGGPGGNGSGPGGSSGKSGESDPNGKIGPSGFGAAGFITPDKLLTYRVDFENDRQATAPAQEVTITDPLNVSLDLATFQLTEIGFGDTLIPLPNGTQHFETNVPMTYNGESFQVQIEAGLRFASGHVYTIFRSVNPAISLPPPVTSGFLPPENGTGRGQGHIGYAIKPKSGLPTGTQIRNVAYIEFDRLETIATNQRDPHNPGAGT